MIYTNLNIDSNQKSVEHVIQTIVKATGIATGQTFLEALVQQLAQSLNIRHCLITQLTCDSQLETLAFWQDHKVAANITYDPAPGPCGVVLKKGIYYCESGVQKIFPNSLALKILEADSYVGVALRSSTGEVVGNLCLLNSSPILDRRLHEDVLKIFASRASAEIERQRATEALQKLNAELEMRVLQRTEELYQSLEKLHSTQAQLLQSAHMSALGQLVAGIAHEINNPVTFIHANVSHAASYLQDLLTALLLYRKHSPTTHPAVTKALARLDIDFLMDDLPKLLSSLEVGSQRICDIVESLRVFSRFNEAECKLVKLHDCLDSTLMLLQHRLNANGAQKAITVNKQYTKLPLVECYPGVLNQAFMNILVNAIDAVEKRIVESSTPNGCITITTERLSQDQVIIKIADNGIGMTDDIIQQIFNPFFTTKPVGQGIGLGLSQSFQIITQKHGGQLSCKSIPGQGSEFTIQIAIAQSHK
ncbi:two-component sensor histidine kinase [Calothrix sp. NIES-4071]|nr:two-component sensor histidine kinase [Calothrix sp. NIES-4071]BAZ55375.1 two-component sensor histidine kinase [Calothrix sp. NIES-4105]